jgi:hypothetical protein
MRFWHSSGIKQRPIRLSSRRENKANSIIRKLYMLRHTRIRFHLSNQISITFPYRITDPKFSGVAIVSAFQG